jgi:hypothetical protein
MAASTGGTGWVKRLRNRFLVRTLKRYRENSRTYRAVVVLGFALVAALAWFVIFFLMWMALGREQYKTLVLPGGIVVAVVAMGYMWLLRDEGRGGVRLAALVGTCVVFWTVTNHLLVSGRWPLWMLVLIGVVPPFLFGAFSLFLPIRSIELKPQEVYYWLPWNADEEDFEFVSRKHIGVDPDVLSKLREAGVPPDALNTFIDAGGPMRLRAQLVQAVKHPYPDQDKDFETLFTRFNKQARTANKLLWVCPLDDVWLFWDKSTALGIDTILKGLVTEGGPTFNLQVSFLFEFDPEAIELETLRLGLPAWRGSVQSKLEGILRGNVKREATKYFITRTLEESLTKESVEAFSKHLLDTLNDFHTMFGTTVYSWSMHCTPVQIPTRVQEAGEDRVAAPSRAKVETAKLERLIKDVLGHGVSFGELSRLLFIENSPNPFVALSSNFFDLPADEQVRRIVQVIQPQSPDMVLQIEQNLQQAIVSGQQGETPIVIPGAPPTVLPSMDEPPTQPPPPKRPRPEPLVDLLSNDDAP